MNFLDRKDIAEKVYNKDNKGNETLRIPAIINTDIGGKLMFGNMMIFGESRSTHKQTESQRYNKKYKL